MERYSITIGDFLKNAGIVGMKYMLDLSKARENIDYGIAEDNQSLWLEKDFAADADWTSMYFEACVKYFEVSTAYQGVLNTIEEVLEKLDTDKWKGDGKDKDNLKFINDKLLSNSYQAGFDNIKDIIDNPEVYLHLKSEKLSVKLNADELRERLQQLDLFLRQPKCRETFVMKSVIYNYINRFWDGKCFLLRANAKKDMRECFENDFSIPLREYFRHKHDKDKDICIDCGMPMGSKEKVSIAFMKDMADDLTRKRSAFWGCRVDAFLCPVCAFVYAVSPLGFRLSSNKFVFVNTNETVEGLISANGNKGKAALELQKDEKERYTEWFARTLNDLLEQKIKELSNIQVILRGIRAEDKYMFTIISRDALLILRAKEIHNALAHLADHPYVKLGDDFVNIHERVVMNILQYKSQSVLLNRVLKESLENQGLIASAYWIYIVQMRSNIIKKNYENGGMVAMNRISVMNSGYALRTAILSAKGAKDDDCMRGTIYQLLNALSVKNEGKFLDIVLRLYSSCKAPAAGENSSKLLVPDGFVHIMGNKEKFEEYGYAFVLGLKGSNANYYKKNDEEEAK